MRHFSEEEWVLYKNHQLDVEKTLQMENHLAKCDHCLDTFLSLIDDEEIAQAEKDISSDFTDRLVFKIKEQKPVRKHRWEKKKNLFIYYMAASIVTLVLMNGGLFRNMIEIHPEIFNTSQRIEHKESMNWPEKVVEGTHNWILNFEAPGKGGFNFE